MDADEERDYADQHPLSDMDMEEDAEILTTLLKHLMMTSTSCSKTFSASNAHLPYLYICLVANVLGRAPLIPCFLGCNRHPTIPHSFKDDRRLGHASADTQRDRGNGSRLYEVHIWMWRYWCLSLRRKGSIMTRIIWNPHKVFSWYIPGIYQVYTFPVDMPGIYLEYSKNMFK